VADLVSIGTDADVVVTAHDLTLVPAHAAADTAALRLDRLVVPGTDARERAGTLVSAVAAVARSVRVDYLHADAPQRFGIEPVIEDLARSADVPTARFALRRLEYRSESVRLEGSAMPWRALALPPLLGTLGVVLAAAAARAWRRRRTARRL
jgi:hypothetical protein